MGIRETITKEVADIRAKAAGIIQTAQGESAKLEADAIALEQKLANIPAEVEVLAEDAADRVWAWVKGL